MGRSNRRSNQRPGKLTVAEILKSTAPQYVKRYPRQAAPQVQSTLAKLSLCRTAALGGHKYQCKSCSHQCGVYNSCGDRHCPTCSGAKRHDWIDSARELILDGVDYFQVVFTMPDKLSRLALGNRREMFKLLFRSAWKSLKKTIIAEQGYDPAALMVLHTWNQKLDAHVHVHAVVPGGGPSIHSQTNDSNEAWKVSKRGDDEDSIGHYLVDAEELRDTYRDFFLKGLNRLRKCNKLSLNEEFAELKDDDAWKFFTDELRALTWVSHIQPPPKGCDTEHVLKYLARYLTGGPISDARITAADFNEVTFNARSGEVTGGESKQVPVTLTTVKFVRRWCLHVLPRGFTKSRRFGGWSNRHRKSYLNNSRQCIAIQNGEHAETSEQTGGLELNESESPGSDIKIAVNPKCPCCKSALILHSAQLKPSWRDLMDSPLRPPWYEPYSSSS